MAARRRCRGASPVGSCVGRVIELPVWHGTWDDDDPDANFKAEVAAYQAADPLFTLANLSARTGVPVEALIRYVLARWASAGSEGLLELGPSLARRLYQVAADAEGVGTDEARLAAFEQLRQRLSWLVVPLQDEAWRDAPSEAG